MRSATVVCIGEMLWDLLPTGRRAAGSPLHLAAQLHTMGQPVQLLSRVGDDELGRELLTYAVELGLSPALVQCSTTHLTGVSKTSVRGGQSIYRIVEPVAWDYLQYTPEARTAVSQAGAVVYNSLAARCPVARETLYRLLSQATYKVFELGLRPPYYRREVVKYLLRQANLVWLTIAELVELMGWFGQPADETTALPWLASHFGFQTICLTKAAAGATLWHAGHLHHATGPALGDGADGSAEPSPLLALLLAGLLQGLLPGDALRQACAARELRPATALFREPV